jgi:hypothetical protein
MNSDLKCSISFFYGIWTIISFEIFYILTLMSKFVPQSLCEKILRLFRFNISIDINAILCCAHVQLCTKLAECPQSYCGEIRQILTFIINLYCPKAFYRPDHSIRIVEYHKHYYCPWTHLHRDCYLRSYNLLAETNNSGPNAVLLPWFVSEQQEPPSAGLELRTLSRSLNLSIISSSYQGISMRSSVHIGLSVL